MHLMGLMDLISKDWKHLYRNETSQKIILKTFDGDNKDTRKINYFQKLFNKEIYFPLQFNSSKYNKTFKIFF